MKKFETHKELSKYEYELGKKLRAKTITPEEMADLEELAVIEKELKAIRNEHSDKYWQHQIGHYMAKHKYGNYRKVKVVRDIQKLQGDKLVPDKFSLTLILPLRFNEKDIKTDKLIDFGEYAKYYYDNGIVVYLREDILDGRLLVGMPLDLYYELNEMTYREYQRRHEEHKKSH